MNPEHPLDEERLQAYVDDRLDPEARAETEARLAADPQLAKRAAAYIRQRKALHETFDPVLDEPLPARLRRAPMRQWLPVSLTRAAAVGVIGLLAGGGLGWFGATALHPDQTPRVAKTTVLAREAATAYAVYTPEVLYPVTVRADQKSHLLAWLSKRLGQRLHAPDLSQYGYHLIGGSLLPANAGPAAQFMYQNDAGQRLTLYVTVPKPGENPTAFHYAKQHGISVFYWIDRDMGYALAARLDRAQLLRIAHGIYRQFTR